MKEFLRRMQFFFLRSRFDRDMEEEMRHHLSLLEEDGADHAAAHRQFGNFTQLKEESRSVWTFSFLEQLLQDARYAVRTMAARPLFTLTAALSLALGIGANTAIYSFMDAILMRYLPVSHPQDLAVLNWHAPRRPAIIRSLNGTAHRYGAAGTESPNFSFSGYERLRSDKDIFTSLFAYTYVQNFNVIVGGQAESITGGFVSGNYFSGLGVPPAAGRLFLEEDDRTGAPATAVLAYSYWQRRFNSNPAAIGQSILINNEPFTIAGVAAPGFFGVDPEGNPSFFLPIHTIPTLSPDPPAQLKSRFHDDHFYWIEMMGRLRPGMSVESAQAALRPRFQAFAASTAIGSKDAETLPELSLEEGGSGLDSLRRQYSRPLLVLMTMVALILAVACANLANLLLARASTRRREIAVRLSLGASRTRILRQMLTESVLLSVFGGVLGLGVALAGIRFITFLLASGEENFTLRAGLNWPVLGYTFAITVIAGILFGLAPAIQSTRLDLTPSLKESRLQGSGSRGLRFRPRLGQFLIVAQIAVSLLLVIGAGLFVRTLANLHAIDVGFNRENILLLSLNGRQAGFREQQLAQFYATLLDRFREMPGVRAASASNFPLVAHYVNDEGVIIPGRQTQAHTQTNLLIVDPAFLETMQIPILLGRSLQRADLAAPTVAVVNQKFISTFFPDKNPLDREFGLDYPQKPIFKIVGVAKAAHYNSLQEESQPVIYIPYTFSVASLGRLFFELRTAGPPMAIAADVRRVVHETSASVPIVEFTTQAQRMDQTISQQNTFANLGS
ncbi:MAG TPA: ABC transporter permease, partial [Bryobacteraceae bacterium]